MFVLAIALSLPTAALATGTFVGNGTATENNENGLCVFVIAGGGEGEGFGYVYVTNYTDNPAHVGVFHESLGYSKRGGYAANCLTNSTGDVYHCKVSGS